MDVDERPDEPKPERRIDAFRRTHLANERTYLAWLRSGLTAVAVGLGVAKFLPDLADAGTTWPYVALGAGFCLLGILMMVVGHPADAAGDPGPGTRRVRSARRTGAPCCWGS